MFTALIVLMLGQTPSCPGGMCGVPYAPYYPAGVVYAPPIRGAYGHHPDCPLGELPPVSPAYGASGRAAVGVGVMPVIPLRPRMFARPKRLRFAFQSFQSAPLWWGDW